MTLGEVRHCPQCGKIVGKNDKFCRYCGAPIDPNAVPLPPKDKKKKKSSKEKLLNSMEDIDQGVIKRATELKYAPADKQQGLKERFNEAKNLSKDRSRSFIIIISWIIIGFSLLFIFYFISVYKADNAPDSQNNTQELDSVKAPGDIFQTVDIESSNPAYLLAPETFISDGKISLTETAPDGQSAWVEEIIDENTFKVSYVEHTGNKNLLKFSQIDLAGLVDFQYEIYHCNPRKMATNTTDTRLAAAEETTIRFLKSFLLEKNITLETPSYKPDCKDNADYSQIEPQGVKRYGYMSVDDVEPKYQMNIKGIENNKFNINRALINLGYAKFAAYDECFYLSDVFDEDEKEAEEKNMGTWADCLFYYKK